MSALTKAQLGEISADDNPTEVPGTLVDVQFNPTSLRVQLSNRTAGGQQAGAQARQRPGTGEMTVSFELVFDTADEGSTEDAVDVLERTRMVERFVRPRGPREGEEAPPRVIFKWGSFIVQGTMESANLDLDLFDARGTPLRARVAVTIKGQDPRWTYTPGAPPNGTAAGTGTGPQSLAGAPGALSAGLPGTVGMGAAISRVVSAMPGESLAQLAARAGFDPAAWRALAAGIDNPLALQLGEEIALPATRPRALAEGQRSQGRDPAASTAELALTPSQPAAGNTVTASSPRTLAADPVRRGQAVAAQGGVQATIDQRHDQSHQHTAQTSLHAFGLGGGATAAADGRPWGAGVPLRPRLGQAALTTGERPAAARYLTPPTGAGSLPAAPLRPATRKAGCGCRRCRQGH